MPLIWMACWPRCAGIATISIPCCHPRSPMPVRGIRSSPSPRARLADLHYDFDALAALMASRGWTTINLVWREDAHTLHARNPFPPGGVVEDPATGAAAAALGAYLAGQDQLPDDRRFTIHQGHDLGCPSVLRVDVPVDVSDGVRVSGTAVEIGVGD